MLQQTIEQALAKAPPSWRRIAEFSPANQCGFLSDKIVIFLRDLGYDAVKVSSGIHDYGLIKEGGEMLVVDPTARQYLLGAPPYLVGSRETLLGMGGRQAPDIHWDRVWSPRPFALASSVTENQARDWSPHVLLTPHAIDPFSPAEREETVQALHRFVGRKEINEKLFTKRSRSAEEGATPCR